MQLIDWIAFLFIYRGWETNHPSVVRSDASTDAIRLRFNLKDGGTRNPGVG